MCVMKKFRDAYKTSKLICRNRFEDVHCRARVALR